MSISLLPAEILKFVKLKWCKYQRLMTIQLG